MERKVFDKHVKQGERVSEAMTKVMAQRPEVKGPAARALLREELAKKPNPKS